MDIRKLQRAIVDGLEDVKAQNIVVFNTEHLSALFERVIIASGTSNRQTKSLASSVREAVKTAGFGVPRTEGEANGEWIIVDCGAAVAHVMQPSIRDYYHLEEIWGGKPVNMKIDNSVSRLVKASAPEPKAGAARKPAAKKAAVAPAANKPAAKTAAKKAPTAKKPVARKIAAPPSRAVVTRVVGVKKLATRAPVASKAPVPAARKVAAGKTAAKKSPARKPRSRA
jgi:ribosome-associated protein